VRELRGAGWLIAAPAALLATLVTPAATLPGHDNVDDRALLKGFAFSAHDLQKIDRGEFIGHTMPATGSAVALSVAGIIRVPGSYYLERFRAIESFKKSPEILQIGRFGTPPSEADLASLTLEGDDIDDLKGCRPGDCGLKLDAQGIARLARRDARADQSSAAMRQHLAEYVQRYLEAGNSSLMEYHDDPVPRRLAGELRTILERSEYLQREWPALYRAVGDFSGSLPDGLDGFVYWSKEKVGPRAVISVTHAVISPPRDGAAAIATKQLYGSHYSYGSLGVTMLLDKGTPEAPRTLVVYVNRSRLDIFGGLLGGIKRPLVRSRAREGAERTLRQLRDRLERDYAAGRKPEAGSRKPVAGSR
jgi:hypothetical protein